MTIKNNYKYLIYRLSCVWVIILVVLVLTNISKNIILLLLISIFLFILFLAVKEKLREDDILYNQIRNKKLKPKKKTSKLRIQ